MFERTAAGQKCCQAVQHCSRRCLVCTACNRINILFSIHWHRQTATALFGPSFELPRLEGTEVRKGKLLVEFVHYLQKLEMIDSNKKENSFKWLQKKKKITFELSFENKDFIPFDEFKNLIAKKNKFKSLSDSTFSLDQEKTNSHSFPKLFTYFRP